MKIILASNSPRRREILENAGFEVVVVPSLPESAPEKKMSPKKEVAFRALEKGLGAEKAWRDELVLSSDTVVVLGRRVLGKPANEEEAREMLSLLSGRVHKVMSAYALFYKGKRIVRVVTTRVRMYPLTKEDIDWYISTRESGDKAGAYGIQGKGARLIKEIRGDYLNVVGLPLSDLCRAIEEIVK